MAQRIESRRSYNIDKYPIIITICFFLAASYVAFFHHNYWTFDSDGVHYLLVGKEILAGNGENVRIINAPIGGSILFASLDLFFNDGFSVIKGIAVLSGAGMVFFSYYIIRNIFDSKTSLLGQLFFAINPWLFLFAIQARNELLPVFLAVIATYIITKKNLQLHHLIIIGCILGAAFMIRYQALFILLAFVVFLIIRNKKIRTNVWHASFLIAFFLLAFSPIPFYNYSTHGSFLDQVDQNGYVGMRSHYLTPEWQEAVLNQAGNGLLAGALVDTYLYLKNYFYNLLYGIPNNLFGFENKVSASLIPMIPILGAIPVLGGLIYSLKVSASKKTLIAVMSTAGITTALVFLLGSFQDHFFAIIIMPIIVIGILNFKNIENNFKPLLLLSLLFLIGMAIIPVRGPIHFAPVWILIATLSAIFFVKVTPEIHGLKNSVNKSKYLKNIRRNAPLIFLFLLILSSNFAYSYVTLRVWSTGEFFVSINDEYERIIQNEPFEKIGMEMEEIASVLSKEPGIKDSYVGTDFVYAAYLDSNRIFFTWVEGPENDTIENYITRENWNKYWSDYSYHTSWPMDRYSKFYQLPDYLIYPPNENHHEFLNKLEDPNNPEIPDNFELIYKSSRGTMVYKIYHND